MKSDYALGNIENIFPDTIKEDIVNILKNKSITEIHLRIHQPILIKTMHCEYFLRKDGQLSGNEKDVHILSKEEMKLTFQKISQYSVFAFKEEIQEGFITISGGHRIGLCGKIYYDANGKRQIQNITSMNIRIAREVRNCALDLFPFLVNEQEFCHTLIVSPPGYGKTTYLRDIIRLLSDGTKDFPGKTVAVVDERSEIANRTVFHDGFYLGKRTDVLDHCPKSDGMMMLLRTMGPEIIAADELGGPADIKALEYIRNGGCKLLMTIHGTGPEELQSRPYLHDFLMDYPFERYIIIEKPSFSQRVITIKNCYDQEIYSARETIQCT